MESYKYFDTGVWIAFVSGSDDPYFHEAQGLVNGIKRKKNLVVSFFGIIEAIDVLKRKIAKEQIYTNKTKDEARAKNSMQKKIKIFMDMIDDLAEEREIAIISHKANMGRVYSDTLDAVRSDLGAIRQLKKSRGYMYKGLGFADYMHAYIARAAGVTDFYTTDAAFGALNGDPRFAGMRFHVLKSGRAQGSP